MGLLELATLSKTFGGLNAVTNVSLNLAPGERHALIGPNGAGKTTLFNLIAGGLQADSGEIFFKGERVTALTTPQRVRMGMSRTFQHNTLFLKLSVFENVRLACQRAHGVAPQMLRPAHGFAEVNAAATELLERVGLSDLSERRVNTLAYAQQRMLELALALANQPELLLLDEPTAGVAADETQAIVQLIKTLPKALSLLIIEHDMSVVFDVADSITVLHHGEVLRRGAPAEVREDEAVQRIYLGEGYVSEEPSGG